MKTKYKQRHWVLSLRENEVLVKSAIGKPLDELKNKDFKRSFVRLWWDKCSGTSILDKNGKELPESDYLAFIHALYRK